MIDRFVIVLEACDPARNRWRSYRLAAGQDLFGTWVVEISFGRIGTAGRTRCHAVADAQAARALVQARLRRRATAQRRLGVPYTVRALYDAAGWAPGFARQPWAQSLPSGRQGLASTLWP